MTNDNPNQTPDLSPMAQELIQNEAPDDALEALLHELEETAADPEQVMRAYVVAREVFGMSEFVAQVEALDNKVSTQAQTELYLEFRRLIDRATRWLLHSRPAHLDVGSEIERFRPAVRELSPKVPDMLSGAERERWERSSWPMIGRSEGSVLSRLSRTVGTSANMLSGR